MTNIKSLVNKLATLLFSVMVFAMPSMCQTNSIPTINQKEEHLLRSRINNNSYQIFVSLPKNYSKADTTTYPVLYLLDGNYSFPIAHSTRQLLDFAGSIEDIIIVGIGYEWEKSYEPWFRERWKDFTPSNVLSSDTNRSFLSVLDLKIGSLTSGGAQEFLGILKNEIMPFVEKNIRANGEKGIAGHSLGGLFAAYCLLHEPGLFNKYGINSPSLWWNHNQIIEDERSFAAKNQKLNAEVFISVGSKEGEMMVSNMTAFSDSLQARHYAGLKLTAQIFEDEGHFSVLPASVTRTLRVLYKPKKK